MADDNVGRASRIIYVDPNDSPTQIKIGNKNRSLTPQYSDFCIAFNLIVEKFPRYRETIGTVDEKDNNDNSAFMLSFVWKDGDKEIYSVTNQGSTFGVEGGQQYLSTYYTDICFDNYGTQRQTGKRQLVEGLGVENVQVTFESWYTPTVTIKFVDVRGSALWANEEATHNDGKLTADNIFGVFFTFPFPKFYLQIKGFLGKPVTYQLTVSGQKGQYNSQTGNFEMIVTFVGYSYSLLTDIPFDYLIAAPLSSYEGKAYWEKNVNEKRWALHDGRPPVMLYQLMQNIRKASEKVGEQQQGVISDSDNAELNNINGEKTKLSNIKTKHEAFIQEITKNAKSSISDYTENHDNNQYVLFFDGGTTTDSVKLSNDSIKAYNELVSAFEDYNNTYTNRQISTDSLPNKWKQAPDSITLTQLFVIKKDASNNITSVTISSLNGAEKTISNVQKTKFNDNKTLIKENAKKIIEASNSPFPIQISRFAYVLDCNDLIKIVKERLDELTANQDVIIRKSNEHFQQDIVNIVGFVPWIGNVFKIIMCHLETFIHIMMTAGSEIYAQAHDGKRTIEALGIKNTNLGDVKGEHMARGVSPWPKIVKKSKEDDGSVIGWVGDISHKFIEEEVIYGIMDGVRRLNDKRGGNGTNSEFGFIPVLPQDFANFNCPYSLTKTNTCASSVAGYMSLRASQILGLLFNSNIDNNTAELLGVMDAYNYYCGANGATGIRNDLFDKFGGNNAINVMTGISLCKGEYDNYGKTTENGEVTRHDFETEKQIAYNNDKRHPIIREVSGGYQYCHFYTKDFIGVVPTRLEGDFRTYKKNLEYTGNVNKNACFFTPQFDENIVEYRVAKDWVHKSDSTKMASQLNVDKNDYVNKNLFNILTDDNTVSAIESTYQKIKDKSVKILDLGVEEDFTPVLNQLWKVDNGHYSKFFKYNSLMLSPKREKLGIDEKWLLPMDKNGSTPSKIRDDSGIIHSNESKTIMNENGEWKNQNETVSLDELCVQEFMMYEGNKYSGSIFGSPFYYMQNNEINGETEEEKAERSRNVKALLFLHTLKYNYSQRFNVFLNSKTSGCTEGVPYGYLLFLGGLLWRKRYKEKKGNDPVISSEGTTKYILPGIDVSFHVHYPNAGIFEFKVKKTESEFTYNCGIVSYFDGALPDVNITNQLIAYFLDFSKNTYSSIMANYELKDVKTDGSIQEYKYNTLSNDIRKFSEAIHSETFVGALLPNLFSSMIVSFLKNEGCTAWYGKYRFITTKAKDANILNLFMEETEQMQSVFKSLYVKKVIITDGCFRRMKNDAGKVGDNDYITFKSSAYQSYVKGFMNKLDKISESYSREALQNELDNNMSNDQAGLREIYTAMYMYLKQLWDRWLLSAKSDEFTVENYFNKFFIFIDSFYRNTYSKLPINCDKLLMALDGGENDRSLFTVLNDIISDHRCIFFALPDYIGFDGGENGEGDVEKMKELFTPVPYNKMGYISKHNKFVVIYTSQPSEISEDDENYAYDGFDIWSIGSDGIGQDVSPDVFRINSTTNTEGDLVTRAGYNVPSFGVAVNKMNNHIFKNINVNMNNPAVTEESIKMFTKIVSLGASQERQVAFHGQDIYPIYSSYCYECEVEMIGNAQIQPLMYFQLLNMPMWRGTYMIFNVTHTLTPGDMTTRFKGMKMNKDAMVFGETFFTQRNEPNYSSDGTSYSGNYGGAAEDANVHLDGSYKKYTTSTDYYHDTTGVYRTSDVKDSGTTGSPVKQILRTTFNNLVETIKHLPENQPKETWNIYVHSGWRSNSKLNHNPGNAIDVSVMHFNDNGTVEKRCCRTYQPELCKVLDILYSCFHGDLPNPGVILEYTPKIGSGIEDNSPYVFGMLHIGINRPQLNGYFLSQDLKAKKGIEDGYFKTRYPLQVGKDKFLNGAPKLWQYMMKKYFTSMGYTKFKSTFLNYQFYDETALKNYFNGINECPEVGAASNRVPPDSRKIQLKTPNKVSNYDDIFKKKASDKGLDWKLIASISWQESSFNANVGNKCCHGLMGINLRYSDYTSATELKEPANNISEGCRMLNNNLQAVKKLTNIPDEQWKFALASYNWGIGSLQNAISRAKSKGKRGDVWYDNVETEAPTETKNYVSYVLYNYGLIKKHLGG